MKAPRANKGTETPVLVPIPTGSLALWGHGHGGTVTPGACPSWDQPGLLAHSRRRGAKLGRAGGAGSRRQ